MRPSSLLKSCNGGVGDCVLTVDSNLCTAKFAVRGLGIYVCALAGLMLVAFTTGIDNVSVSLMCRGSMPVSLSHVLTQLGGNVAAVVIAGCGAIIAAARHRFAWVLGFVLVPFLLARVGALLKQIIARPRPPAMCDSAHLTGFSFPSSHAISAAVGFLLLAFFIEAETRARLWPSIVAWVLTSLVGISRFILGAHYPSDILCGLVLGSGFAYGTTFLLERLSMNLPLVYHSRNG